MTRPKAKRKNRRQRGTAIVEAAIVLTLLLMLTLGALEYGWMFINLQRINNAARQGARVASASGATDADGEQAITDLLGVLPIAPDVQTDLDTGTVTATVVVDSATVSLVHFDLLPMPEQLKAVVTMAKEAQ